MTSYSPGLLTLASTLLQTSKDRRALELSAARSSPLLQLFLMLSELIPILGFESRLSGDDTLIYTRSSDLPLELQTHLYAPNAWLTVPPGRLIVLSNVAYPKHNP